MGTARSQLFTLIELCLCIVVPLCHSIPLDHSNVALFVFGDSLFDSGNNNYLKTPAGQANVFPYGETYFHHPTGRFSDGRIIPDFIAKYAKLPLVPPYLQPGSYKFYTFGSNFASGGAGALSETRSGMVVNLKTQLTYFKTVKKKLKEKLGYAQTKKLLSTAIYMFSIGGNDYVVRVANLTTLNQPYTREEYVGMVIGNLTDVIKEIYKSEGRKFGFVNVPPLDRVPFGRSVFPNSTSELSKLEKLHNKALSKALKELQRQLQGFKYSEFDFYASLNERIDNPSKYGFKVANEGCCGSGQYRGILSCGRGEYALCENLRDYLFFDGAHPTEKANNQISKLIWSGSSDYATPTNLYTLFQT